MKSAKYDLAWDFIMDEFYTDLFDFYALSLTISNIGSLFSKYLFYTNDWQIGQFIFSSSLKFLLGTLIFTISSALFVIQLDNSVISCWKWWFKQF